MMLDDSIAAASIALATLFSTTLASHYNYHYHHHHHYHVPNQPTIDTSSGFQFECHHHRRRCLGRRSAGTTITPSHHRQIHHCPRRRRRQRHSLSNHDNIVVLNQGVDDAEGTTTPYTKKVSIPNQLNEPSPLSGMPIGPSSTTTTSKSQSSYSNPVIIRYMYEGGHLSQGRLCSLDPSPSTDCSTTSQTPISAATADDDDVAGMMSSATTVTIPQIIQALRNDGVDFNLFYPCAYESECSTGGWLPLESAPRYRNPWKDSDDGGTDGSGADVPVKEDEATLTFTIPSSSSDSNDPSSSVPASRRIDIKLFRRPKMPSRGVLPSNFDWKDTIEISNAAPDENELTPTEYSNDALHAISASVPCGKLSNDGYFGIGILHPKACENVGTLWRSAYQLGASILYTIGGRYKSSSTDTLNVPARIPLIELDDWTSFVEWASPKSAVWVVIEMGGTPLSEFVHPRNAIYILGSEDHGVPKSVVRGCREVVSLECELYGSYNVAVAGSIVMYDRMMKMRKANEQPNRKKSEEEK